MSKGFLHLSIDTELLALAKSSKLNLSGEFEEWVRIRLNQNLDQEPLIDHDLEIAKHRQQIAKHESKKAIIKTAEMKEKEKIMVVDNMIDNHLELSNDKPEHVPEKRFKGLMFLFDKKFRIKLSDQEAKDILSNRIKERGL